MDRWRQILSHLNDTIVTFKSVTTYFTYVIKTKENLYIKLRKWNTIGDESNYEGEKPKQSYFSS